MMTSISIALTKLEGANIVDIGGKKCVCIPVEDNRIFISNRGQAYLSLSMYPYRAGEAPNNNTHYLKRQKTKGEEKEAYQKAPIVGYGREFGDKKEWGNSAEGHDGNRNYNNESLNINSGNPAEDLPF